MRAFAYRLALELGEADVDGLLGRLTWKQLQGWMAYYRLDPWGQERADLRAGIVASTTANVWRGKRRPLQPRDFMPRFGARTPKLQTKEQALSVLMTVAQAHNEGMAHGRPRSR